MSEGIGRFKLPGGLSEILQGIFAIGFIHIIDFTATLTARAIHIHT